MALSQAFITQKIQELKQQYAHAGDFCFFTNIDNLPSIFSQGALLSRKSAAVQNLIKSECAAAAVLSVTPEWVMDYVRLYFAPATPMLYQVEGIKRKPDDWPECPMPVYFRFDPKILQLDGVKISNGNLGSGYTTCQDASDEFFNTLPFDRIYHRGAFEPGSHAGLEFIRCRHAEVLLPSPFPLAFVTKMVFRSAAERDLGLSLTGGQKIISEVDKSWFNCRRPYLETAKIEDNGERSLGVANTMPGDDLVRVIPTSGIAIKVYRCVFQPSFTWGSWEAVDTNAQPSSYESDGRNRVFLRGHRVAEWI